jgi:hypothetical protein
MVLVYDTNREPPELIDEFIEWFYLFGSFATQYISPIIRQSASKPR